MKKTFISLIRFILFIVSVFLLLYGYMLYDNKKPYIGVNMLSIRMMASGMGIFVLLIIDKFMKKSILE